MKSKSSLNGLRKETHGEKKKNEGQWPHDGIGVSGQPKTLLDLSSIPTQLQGSMVAMEYWIPPNIKKNKIRVNVLQPTLRKCIFLGKSENRRAGFADESFSYTSPWWNSWRASGCSLLRCYTDSLWRTHPLRGELARYQQIHLGGPQLPTTNCPPLKKRWDLQEFLNEVLRLICFSWRTCIDEDIFHWNQPLGSQWSHVSSMAWTPKSSFSKRIPSLSPKWLSCHLRNRLIVPLPWQVRDMVTWYTVLSCPLHIEKKKRLPPRIHLHHLPCKNRISILM